MKFRVMASDETLEDFDIEAEARVLYDQKKKKTGRLVVTGRIRSCSIHKCYHDETPPKPCEIIEQVTK